jgi:hypothetical protein
MRYPSGAAHCERTTIVSCTGYTAGPQTHLREPSVGRPDWRAATPRREEQEIRPLLAGVAEQATAGIAPMLGLELIHAPTLGPPAGPRLIIPGNYT